MPNRSVETKGGEDIAEFSTGAVRGTENGKPRFDDIKPEVVSLPYRLMDGFGLRMKYNGWEFLVERCKPINFSLPFQETDTSMIPNLMLNRLGGLFWRGAQKYSRDNWKKGINLSRTFGSMFRHAIYYWAGDTSEDHLAAIIWNATVLMWTEREIASGNLPNDLADCGPMNGWGK